MFLKEWFVNKAFKFVITREFEKAEKLLSRSLEENRENYPVLVVMGDLYTEKEEIEKAREYYINALEVAKKQQDELKRLIVLLKLRRIQGETIELNHRIFNAAHYLGLKKLCENSLNKLLREEVIEDSIPFLIKIAENVFKDEEKVNYIKGILKAFQKEKDKAVELLQSAREVFEEKGETEYVEKIDSLFISAEKEISVKELEDILEIEGLSEKKLEPSATYELADLLRSIGSQDEAITEYFSSIYGYLLEEQNIEKGFEILEKIKEIAPDDPRIPKVEEFLKKIKEGEGGVSVKDVDFAFVKEELFKLLIPEEKGENWITFLNSLSEWNLIEEAYEWFKDIEKQGISPEVYAPYYLYVLYSMGEFEEVIERAEKYLDSVEKEENLLFIKYFKALSLYKLGEKDSALDLFAEIYESSPDFLDVKDYIEEEAEVEKEVIEAPLVNREEETQEEPTEEIVEEEPEEVLEVISEDKEEEKVEEIKEVKEKIYKRDLKEHFIIL